MKKFIKILTVFVLALVLIPNAKALNKKVLTVDATESKNGVISVSGTTEEGMLAVAIQVYDEKGETLITMKTTSVSENTFEDTITVEAGNYVVKVADYDGGDYASKEVTPSEEVVEETTEKTETDKSTVKNAKTGDNVMLYVTLTIVSLIGVSYLAVRFKKQMN